MALFAVSCTLGGDDDDEHPPICQTCVGPAPESAIPAEGGEQQPPTEPRPGGFTGTVTGGRGGFDGRGGAGGTTFGTGGRLAPFDTGGGFNATTGGTSFGSGGSTFGGFSSAFAGSAAFGGF
jgi:hypothetical protein